MPNQSLIDKLLQPYTLPDFANDKCDGVVPTHRLRLAHLPTPIEDFSLPECPEDFKLSLKRDDLTGGIELTGNKVRKLEFILADALSGSQPAGRIYTAGGTQSNHARATVAACAKLGLPVEIFLRRDPSNANGNVFLDQLFGAIIHEFDVPEWKTFATNPAWLEERATVATAANPTERVFPVPIGGSTPMGSWGYIEFVNEVSKQISLGDIDSVVCTTGSGGTLAGLGLGMHLYNLATNNATRVVAYNICDTPQWFEEKVQTLTKAITSTVPSAKELVSIRDARGNGYALNTVEELQFISRVAREHGVAFDTCYAGKALFYFWKEIAQGKFGGQKALYIHTGGGTSLFDKKDRLLLCDPSL